ncbi:MAG: hypothetical protein EPO55_01475 [Reyranella sp.]|uniref:hypothetical protein n=1 Tax=Reyranella sp. TaxID=1929291 RepID=UPI001223FEF4|nr:hypothetical protein [Reyranella sp.]TAJ42539.1 MAG: hypothetical protein EPO55_01475 [Reyranella sp.]
MATAAYWIEAPFAAAGMVAACIASVWNKWLFLRLVAMLRRHHAPQAEDRSKEASIEKPFLVQIADVHVTGNGTNRVDGGPSGDWICAEIAKRRIGGTQPKFCVVTGDLIDRGKQAEWDFAIGPLAALRDCGCRVGEAKDTTFDGRHYTTQHIRNWRTERPPVTMADIS